MLPFINQRHGLELADVFNSCKQELAAQHTLCPIQQKAVDDITACRTSQLGGHINCCTYCGYEKPAYNSCRNRHCPKCQFIKQEQWVDKLKGRLIPGRYFHVVFTIPELLNPLFYINQANCYHLLFHAASEALQKAGRNPSFLGADTGAVAVLHTWGQTLTYHPHIHMLVPAGGLSDDQTHWIEAPKKFFVPVKALSSIFRGVLIRELKSYIDQNKFRIPENMDDFEALKKKLYMKDWNVYSKKALGGVNGVLAYLGRYTHRVAISNSRLISLEQHKVSFVYRDYRQANRQRTLSLDQTEFVRRFLQHVLPSGFYKIRYFGILATVHIHAKREQAIALIGKTMLLPILEGLSAYEVIRELTGKDPARCPKCKTGWMSIKMMIDKPG
jgi:predicted Zn-ribbon and HTH transcriptional regulator